MSKKQVYFTCSTNSCFGCPYCEKVDDIFNLYACSLAERDIKNVYVVPDWCPLPEKKEDLFIKSCVICKHYDIWSNMCMKKDAKISDRKCFCKDFEIFVDF